MLTQGLKSLVLTPSRAQLRKFFDLIDTEDQACMARASNQPEKSTQGFLSGSRPDRSQLDALCSRLRASSERTTQVVSRNKNPLCFPPYPSDDCVGSLDISRKARS